MKKLFLTLSVFLCSLTCFALNELVAPLGDKIKDGDFYSVRILMPEVEKAVASGDRTVFSDADIAASYYYEAIANSYLFEQSADKDAKLKFVTDVLGEDHYMTRSLKAYGSDKMQAKSLQHVEDALSAIADELGEDSWSYLSMAYFKTDMLGNLGKFQDSYDYLTKILGTLPSSGYEKNWLGGCMNTLKSVILTNLQRFNEAEPGVMAGIAVFNDYQKAIEENRKDALVQGGQAHLVCYVSSMMRAFGGEKEAIQMSESMMKHLELMGMDKTGLGMEYKSNVGIALLKTGKYQKGKPMVEEYLKYLESKGQKGSPSYNYASKMLKGAKK